MENVLLLINRVHSSEAGQRFGVICQVKLLQPFLLYQPVLIQLSGRKMGKGKPTKWYWVREGQGALITSGGKIEVLKKYRMLSIDLRVVHQLKSVRKRSTPPNRFLLLYLISQCGRSAFCPVKSFRKHFPDSPCENCILVFQNGSKRHDFAYGRRESSSQGWRPIRAQSGAKCLLTFSFWLLNSFPRFTESNVHLLTKLWNLHISGNAVQLCANIRSIDDKRLTGTNII